MKDFYSITVCVSQEEGESAFCSVERSPKIESPHRYGVMASFFNASLEMLCEYIAEHQGDPDNEKIAKEFFGFLVTQARKRSEFSDVKLD